MRKEFSNMSGIHIRSAPLVVDHVHARADEGLHRNLDVLGQILPVALVLRDRYPSLARMARLRFVAPHRPQT
jgi:hypothetical protein